MKKILICEFHQETNTFNPVTATKEYFNAGGAFEGEDVFKAKMSYPCEISGAVNVFRENGYEVIPTIFMVAPSGGKVDDALFNHLKERITYHIENSGEFDAVYAGLHGATCTESDDDACGSFAELLRTLVKDKPIAVSFDLHANVTEKTFKSVDVVCGYQSYPHVDMYETGRRTAALLLKTLSGEKLTMTTVNVPILIPPAGYSNLEGPFKEVIDCGKAMIEKGEVLDFTVFPVQPWLDIENISSTVVTISSKETCENAKRLAEMLFDLRGDVMPKLYSVDDIIDIAEENKSGMPVIAADSADSPNGGAVGDSPYVAMKLIERKSKLRAGIYVVDEKSVEKAFKMGVGAVGEFTVGAGYTPGIPGPLKAEGRVISLHDGSFITEGPQERGKVASLGKTAVVRFGTVDVILCHMVAKSGDPQVFRHFGIEPTLYDLIVVKANTSFRKPYSKFSNLIYVADTPGAGSSNLKLLKWNKLPEGIYPFDLPEEYKISETKVW
ncbi:MAG: M81 family metallopeptidase [Clostridia bacterium]|nr:M81 family metallopeptidase [Clostridia bacterium]